MKPSDIERLLAGAETPEQMDERFGPLMPIGVIRRLIEVAMEDGVLSPVGSARLIIAALSLVSMDATTLAMARELRELTVRMAWGLATARTGWPIKGEPLSKILTDEEGRAQ